MKFIVEDRKFLLSESNSKTLPEWIEYFGNKYTKNQIYSMCYNNNKSIKKITKEEKSRIQSQNSRKYNINEHFFKEWSEEMAYVFGFWCADGCIYNSKMFDITIHKRDKYILKRIAELLDYEGNTTDYVDKQTCRINFSCITIYEDLVALGGSERKGLTLEFPQVPREYVSHFIRGYFDGDGCIMKLKNNRVNSAFTCGSKKFLMSLHEVLKEEAGIIGGSYDDSCCSLKFGKKDTRLLGEYMYKNDKTLFLKRKKEKFKF